jgi:hypothetical protein
LLYFYQLQVPDKAALQPKIALAANALGRAAHGLPEEWTYQLYLAKLSAKAGGAPHPMSRDSLVAKTEPRRESASAPVPFA